MSVAFTYGVVEMDDAARLRHAVEEAMLESSRFANQPILPEFMDADLRLVAAGTIENATIEKHNGFFRIGTKRCLQKAGPSSRN